MQVFSVLVRGAKPSDQYSVTETLQRFYGDFYVIFRCQAHYTPPKNQKDAKSLPKGSKGLIFWVFLPYSPLPPLSETMPEFPERTRFVADHWTLQVRHDKLKGTFHRENTLVKDFVWDGALKATFTVLPYIHEVNQVWRFEVTITFAAREGDKGRPLMLKEGNIRLLGAINTVTVENDEYRTLKYGRAVFVKPGHSTTFIMSMQVPEGWSLPNYPCPILSLRVNQQMPDGQWKWQDHLVCARPEHVFLPILSREVRTRKVDESDDNALLLQCTAVEFPYWNPDAGERQVSIPWQSVGARARQAFHQNTDRSHYERELEDYSIPRVYLDQLGHVSELKYHGPIHPQRGFDQFRDALAHMLWMEETHRLMRLAPYDQRGITLIRFTEAMMERGEQENHDLRNMLPQGECLLLVEVAEMVEEEGSAIRQGHHVFLWETNQTVVQYECRVVSTWLRNHVVVLAPPEFAEEYPELGRTQFNVHFAHPRSDSRMLQRAVRDVNLDLLYGTHPPNLRKPFERVFEFIPLNTQQQSAVTRIVTHRYRRPFLILGPFGTGKSTTLAAATLSVVHHTRTSRVLLCAMTNSGADVLLGKLAEHLNPTQLFRAAAENYEARKHREYYRPDERLKTKQELEQFRVIVTTCDFAAHLYGLGVSPFSHVFLDEAGQLIQPRAMIPLCLANEWTNIVMAGDYHQLGPQLQCRAPTADHLRLDLSPLQGLRNDACYTNSEAEEHIQRLTVQHRCPKEISEFSYRQFYRDYVHNEGQTWEYAVEWQRLPYVPRMCLGLHDAYHPVVFHHMRNGDQGEQRDPHSPSIFNRSEVLRVVELVRDLIDSTGISSREVAVIAEQYRHRRMIVLELRARNYSNVSVLSSHGMQGREFPYVFITTAISRPWEEPADAATEHRRIWEDPKKLNTAMTRASRLVYIVGDGYTLRTNNHWNQLLQYCSHRKSIIGYFNLNLEKTFKILPPQKGTKAPPLASISHYPQIPAASVASSTTEKKKKKRSKQKKAKAAQADTPKESRPKA